MELLKTMQVFIRLAELESFTKTADALQTGRPQVTKVIQELEAELGVRLFQRTTRKVKLTNEGELFYQRANAILNDIRDTTSMFNRAPVGIRGKLRIDIPTAFVQAEFMACLKEFSLEYPHVQIILGATDRAIDLVSEGVDCVLRIGELSNSSLIAKRIGYAKMITCAAPCYIAQFGQPQSVAELHQHKTVSFLSGQSKRPMPWHFLSNGVDESFTSQSGFTVNESHAYIQAALTGFGIIQAPGIVVTSSLETGALVEVLENQRPESLPVSLLYPNRAYIPQQVRTFIDWIPHKLQKTYAKWLEY